MVVDGCEKRLESVLMWECVPVDFVCSEFQDYWWQNVERGHGMHMVVGEICNDVGENKLVYIC